MMLVYCRKVYTRSCSRTSTRVWISTSAKASTICSSRHSAYTRRQVVRCLLSHLLYTSLCFPLLLTFPHFLPAHPGLSHLVTSAKVSPPSFHYFRPLPTFPSTFSSHVSPLGLLPFPPALNLLVDYCSETVPQAKT